MTNNLLWMERASGRHTAVGRYTYQAIPKPDGWWRLNVTNNGVYVIDIVCGDLSIAKDTASNFEKEV